MTFLCRRCGDCCRHYVIVTDAEIDRINSRGYKEFTVVDPFARKGKCLKLVGNRCFFLEEQQGLASCLIYDIRPKVCSTYPFFNQDIKDCRPTT